MSATETIQRLLNEGLTHHNCGEHDLAGLLYRQVLNLDPGNAQALHLLGVIALQDEDSLGAIGLLEQSVFRDDKVAEAHANLGLAYALTGNYGRARVAFEHAIAINPRFAEAHNNLGLAQQQLEEHEAAAEAFRTAVGLRPNWAPYHYNLGLALLALQRNEGAVKAFSVAVSLQPDHAEAHYNLGIAYHRLGRLSAAETGFRDALAAQPDQYAATQNLGTTLYDLGRFEDAATCYREALVADSDNAELWLNLGMALYQQDLNDEAIEAYLSALSLDSCNAQAHYLLGNLHRSIGDPSTARDCYNQAIECQPDHGPAYRARARLALHRERDEDIAAMERLLANPAIADEPKMHVGFALGKAMEDLGQYQVALSSYMEANRQRRAQFDYDIGVDRARFTHWQHVFSKDLFRQFEGAGCHDQTPIFIVGMPRSGTSLVEQILASHPDVRGAGELKLMNEVADRYLDSENPDVYPASIQNVDAAVLHACGEAYISELRARFGETTRISDKMPGNFQHLGLIRLILPQATVIHCRRGPEDTCLSIFKNYFSADGLYYAYNLEELGTYYKLYDNLMAHWEQVCPGFVKHVQYEDLVNDLEGGVRQLLDLCGLDWHRNCMNFHQTRRSVKTASASQVRNPVYADSVNKWQKFKPGLQPLLDSLRS